MDQNNSVRKVTTKSAITVDNVKMNEFQKEGTVTAQLRQIHTTVSYYPTKQISNDLKDNPFSLSDFGFEEQDFTNTDTRVTWVDVPANASADDVLAKIPENACIYRFISNHPILSSNQHYAVSKGLRTMDDFANSQVVRHGDNHVQAGQIILDTAGKPQYMQRFYSSTPKSDVDNRTSDADFYASEAIQSELTGVNVVAGQTI